jgi:hypothetical protein
MTGRSVRVGVLAGAALTGFYALVIVWASGAAHLRDQAAADWPWLAAIIAGFAVQVALLVELRHRHAAAKHEQAAAGAGAGASAAGMVACCAHHIADLLPIVGLSGAATFVGDWRIELMAAGIAVNAVGVLVAGRRLRADTRRHENPGTAWHAVA